MLGSLSLALLASAVAGTTPCESLKSLSTPQAVIESAEECPGECIFIEAE